MAGRHALLTKNDVTLGANETRIFLLLIDLEVQCTALIQRRRHMTSVSAAAGAHCNFERLWINRIHLCRQVAVSASQVRMHAAFMAVSAGRHSPLPRLKHDSISDSHCLRQSRIEVSAEFNSQICQLMTDLAIRRIRCDSRVSIVTSETSGVTGRDRLERALLQPECITQILGRFGYVFFARLALWLIRLMTDPTVCLRFLLLSLFPRNRNKPCSPISLKARGIATDYLQMCFMWKMHGELAGTIASWTCSAGHVAQTRKEEAHSISRRYCDMAIRTNLWRRSLACEELLTMAIKTRCVLRELSYIGESGVALTNFFPVRSRKLMARVTCQLLLGNVSSMREVCVIDARLSARLCASLCCGRNGRQNKANY